jgi:hypothetical protein
MDMAGPTEVLSGWSRTASFSSLPLLELEVAAGGERSSTAERRGSLDGAHPATVASTHPPAHLSRSPPR